MPDTWCPVCDYSVIPGKPCENCVEVARRIAVKAAEARADEIQRLGGIKAFERFTLTHYDNKELVTACAGFPARNLFLWGTAGAGKTHLAVALARQQAGALVTKPQQIYRDLRGHKKTEDEERVLRGYINREPLVIDDLGCEKSTDFSYSSIYEILDGRDMGYKKGLIITSNLDLGALAQKFKDDRITSRIAGLCGRDGVINVTGDDRRMS